MTAHYCLFSCLHALCSREDGSLHWQRPGKEPEVALPYYRPRAPSAEVEMTAYVLLAALKTQPAPSQDELSFASLIAKWISGQQNPSGGFSSTQVSCFLPRPHASMPEDGQCQRPRWELSTVAQGGSSGPAVPATAPKQRLACQGAPLETTDTLNRNLNP